MGWLPSATLEYKGIKAVASVGFDGLETSNKINTGPSPLPDEMHEMLDQSVGFLAEIIWGSEEGPHVGRLGFESWLPSSSRPSPPLAVEGFREHDVDFGNSSSET
jgi:hypothetical protein